MFKINVKKRMLNLSKMGTIILDSTTCYIKHISLTYCCIPRHETGILRIIKGFIEEMYFKHKKNVLKNRLTSG